MKVLLASPIDPHAVAVLEQRYEVRHAMKAEPAGLMDAIVGRESVVLRSGVQLTADVLSAADRLQLIVRAGSGLDNIVRRIDAKAIA